MPRRLCLIALIPSLLLAQQRPLSAPASDAPELAVLGSYHVGVRTLHLVNPKQVDILSLDRKTGKAPLYDRHLTVEVWYPATPPAGKIESTQYEASVFWSAPKDAPKTFKIPGHALGDAPPLRTTEKFPLVIVSHGYPGSRYFLTYLTENLASKG
jgi:Platelet-activating factor acetylhydrolase, isoform II